MTANAWGWGGGGTKKFVLRLARSQDLRRKKKLNVCAQTIASLSFNLIQGAKLVGLLNTTNYCRGVITHFIYFITGNFTNRRQLVHRTAIFIRDVSLNSLSIKPYAKPLLEKENF